MSVSLYVCLSVCLSLSVCLFNCLSLQLLQLYLKKKRKTCFLLKNLQPSSKQRSTGLSIICLSFCLSVSLSVCLSLCLFDCLSLQLRRLYLMKKRTKTICFLLKNLQPQRQAKKHRFVHYLSVCLSTVCLSVSLIVFLFGCCRLN